MSFTADRNDFAGTLARAGRTLTRGPVRILQVNLTRRCNLACHHCHVESGPKRKEALSARGAERVVALLEANPGVSTLDLTGGAPELSPHFRYLVRSARRLGRRVIDRCNLTVLLEPGQGDTARFLADQSVDIVASLPCYTPGNVDAQRGRGVFEASILALRELNALGYGRAGSGLRLDLVYNPLGASLPPGQRELEVRYREELSRLFGVSFNGLIALANMPIKRFARELERRGESEAYQALLVNHFNPETVSGLMCRDTLSVSYTGELHDCDFNQMLELPLGAASDLGRARPSIFDVLDFRELEGASITTAPHCFGCTAGAGSGCGGALT